MDSYVPCDACRRHVRHARCPFCGAEVIARPAPPRPIVGRITRAALFYGASALSGCAEPSSQQSLARLDAGPPMEPVATELPSSERAPIAGASIEPDSRDERARERAHAEAGKRRVRAMSSPGVGPLPQPQPI